MNGSSEDPGSYNHRRKFVRATPLSPERDGLILDERGGKKLSGSGGIKIDLSCHETDSAVVTSSSDVIVAENAELSERHHHHSEHAEVGLKHRHQCHLRSNNLIIINGDDHGAFESVGAGGLSRSPSTWCKSHNVFGTVDGVSSTSPEPKNESVRKGSPDPGVGLEPLNPAETPVSPGKTIKVTPAHF